MKYLLLLLIVCAACTRPKEVQSPPALVNSKTAPAREKKQNRELQKIAKWFEQMDAIFRESVWVLRKDRPPQGKSIFGKMHRAILVEMKEKLSNKSLFRCDLYSMTRDVGGIDGVPQKAQVLHKCGSKESFVKIGDWDHPKAQVLTMNFQGGNLGEVLGLATGVFSPKISCELKANESGTIESFSCKDLMIDFDVKKNQVFRFDRFEYQRSASKILKLRGEVLENLDPVRKIEADVPLEGSILVTETVLQEPMIESKLVTPSPTPTPLVNKPLPKELPNGQSYDPQNNPHYDPQSPPPPILSEEGPGQPDQGGQDPHYDGQADSGEVLEEATGQTTPEENPNQGQIQEVDPRQNPR